jgi:FkbM family methyltransferase
MIKKLKLYNVSDIFRLVKHSIGNRLIRKKDDRLNSEFNLINILHSRGVRIERVDSDLIFKSKINDKPYTFSLRKNSSDSIVFLQIMIYNEYKIIAEFFKNNTITLNTIVDAGANIGLTSIYLNSFYPNAKIYALEPFDSNFRSLNNNINSNNLENITTIKKGLWGHSTYLSPDASFRGGLECSFRLIETSDKTESSIEVVSISDIMNQFNLDTIDF